ncbi:MAG: polymorphic toxin-type HINT domain-containing protein [Leptospiraceae bacterium]|nr:polymorphic toxin-type HINT domain-containing protein [Leptospiraceae bacterium]
MDVQLPTRDGKANPWNHPFWVEGKRAWVEARDLKSGDRVLLSNGKEVAISGIRSYNVEATKVYNFEVADNHTYFVGEDGVLVHNYELSYFKNEKGYALTVRDYVNPLFTISPEAVKIGGGVDPALADQIAIKIYSDVYGINDIESDGSVRVLGERDKIKNKMDVILYDIVSPTLRKNQIFKSLPTFNNTTGILNTLSESEQDKIFKAMTEIMNKKEVYDRNLKNYYKNRGFIDGAPAKSNKINI